MKVLFFSIHDWANVGQTFARALKISGYNAKAFSMHKAVYQYSDREEVYTNFNRLKDVFDESDVIVLMHSNPNHVKIPFDMRNKKVAVFHGGSEYREKPELMNAVFNPLVYVSLIQSGDLLDKGARNQKWILTGINTDRIRPRKVSSPNPSKLVIAHYPRHPHVKGTIFITSAIDRLRKKYGKKFLWYYSEESMPWKKNQDRMAKCDIYVDAVQPTIGDRDYGEWGVQALEAAAMGKVVVTHFRSADRYEKMFGVKCPFVVTNSEADIYKNLENLILMPPDEFKKLQKETRKWVETHHSLKALGKRLVEALELNNEGS